jgi:hypothetical protein
LSKLKQKPLKKVPKKCGLLLCFHETAQRKLKLNQLEFFAKSGHPEQVGGDTVSIQQLDWEAYEKEV